MLAWIAAPKRYRVSRKHLWKRWRKWAFVLAIFAVGIPLSTALAVRSSGSRARLHALAAGAIHDELGLDARIGTVSLQLVPFTLVARDITLDDPVYGRFAEADELRIRPSLRALLRGAVDIDGIEIRGASLRLVVRNGQIRNLPRAEGQGGAGGPTLPFDELRVVRSTLTIDAEPHASGQLRGVDVTVRGEDSAIVVEARSSGGWARHRRGRERLESLEARIAIAPESLRVDRLAVRTPEASVELTSALLPLPFREHGYSGHVAVSYDLSHLARLPLPEGVTLPPIEGRVDVDAELSTADREQRAEGTVTLAGVRIEQFGIGETGTIRFAADRRRVRVLRGSQVELPLAGGRVDVEGSVSLDPARGFPVDVRADVGDLSFARLMNVLGVTENAIVEWFFDGSLLLRGTLEPLALEGPVNVRTHDFVVSHDPWHRRPVRRVIGVSDGRFTSRWSIRPDGVRFENILGELPRSRIRGDLLLGFHNELELTARAEVADMRDITPLDRFPIAGVGDARVTIAGTFQDPRVTGHLRLADFVFDDFELGNVESDAELDPDGLGVRFAMVSAVKNESRYRVEDLYLDFHHDRFALSGLMHADGLLLADFYSILGFEEDERFAPYQGLARGQANISYTNGFPDDSPSGTLVVDMNLGFDWANLNDYAFTNGRLVGRWRWLDWSRGVRGAELAIAQLSLSKGGGTVTLDGRMSLGGQLRMDAVADRVALRDIEGIGERFEGLDGVASAIGRIGGTFDLMRADFDVGLTNVTYGGRALGDGRFFVRHTDRDDPWITAARAWDRSMLPSEPCAYGRTGLAFSDWPADPPIRTVDGPEERLSRPMAFIVCGSGLDDRLTVDLAIGRTEPLPVRGIVRLDGLDLSPLLPTTSDGRRIEGRTSGLFAFDRGALRTPETLEGSVVLSEVRFWQDDLEVANVRPVELVFSAGELSVSTARFAGSGSRLRVRGRASLDDGLALSVEGDVDLGLLARLSQTITEASGHVTARLSITGPMADPELYGQAVVRDGAFRFASFDTPVEHLAGRVEFSQRSVLFEDFTADVAGGTLTASGQAELREQEIERYTFDLQASGVRYSLGEGIDATFGGTTRFAWNRGERLPALTGELVVDRLSYTRSIELRGILGEAASRVATQLLGRRRERAEVRRYDPDQDVLRLDLRVTQRAPFRLRNNLVDAEVRIQTNERPFRIVGTDQRYGLLGTLELVRGDLFFQNNEFDVRRGIIRFDDSTRIDPHVDVEAVTEIRRASDLSAPSWRVILSLTGPSENLRLQTRSEPGLPEQDILLLLAFGMTSGELQQLQQGDLAGAAALEALTAVTGLDREVQRALPLIDEIRVTTGYSARTGRSEPRLSVGRRIADQVRVSATTGLGESRDVRAGVEVQLDDNQRVGISYDNYNNTGANSLGNLGIDWGVRLEFE